MSIEKLLEEVIQESRDDAMYGEPRQKLVYEAMSKVSHEGNISQQDLLGYNRLVEDYDLLLERQEKEIERGISRGCISNSMNYFRALNMIMEEDIRHLHEASINYKNRIEKGDHDYETYLGSGIVNLRIACLTGERRYADRAIDMYEKALESRPGCKFTMQDLQWAKELKR